MSRLITFGLVAFVLCTVALAAPVPKEDAQPKETWIGDRLQKTVQIPGFDDPKTTLREALDNLTKLTEVTFTVNRRAFRAGAGAGMDEVDVYEIAAARPFPAMKAPLGTVLREILEAVESEEVTYLVRGDRIEILPRNEMLREIYGEDAVNGQGFGIKLFPLVHLKASDKPLREMLKQVSDQADVNIVVDPRCGDKGKADLSVKLVNAPADTAVETLADMAGLEMVAQRNVLYVTTPENAAKIRKEQERRMNLLPGGGPFGPQAPQFGPGAGPVPPPGGP